MTLSTLRVRALYESIAVRAFDLLQSPVLLFFRLFWFLPLVKNGWGKLHNLPQVTEFFASLGIPFPGVNAVFIAVLECVGGLLLALGLFSRPLAFLMVCNFTVALLTVTSDREALLGMFSDPDKFLQAAPSLYWIASFVLLAFGPGKLALDTLLARWPRFRSGTERIATVPA